jgi:hypothetical protein
LRDIVIQDGTSFALHDGLAEAFKGRFTTISPAAVELHCTMSVFSDNLETVVITGDAECERHHLPEAAELKDKLILADRGYDSTQYMLAVDDDGGFFLIRVRKTLNPRVIKIHRRGSRYRKLEGKRLRTVLRHLTKDKQYDMDVGWEERDDELRPSFRLVVAWNPAKKDWMRLMTNLDRGNFSTQDILQAYRIRWQIELLFKELKSYSNLHKFSTTKEFLAEGLMWAALCTAFLKRHLAHAGQQVLGVAVSTRRVAMCAHNIFVDLCRSMLQGARRLAGVLRNAFVFFAHNARRTNRKRENTTGRLAIGLRTAGGNP